MYKQSYHYSLVIGLVRFFLHVGLEVGGIVRKVETEFSQAYLFFGVGELLLHFCSSCGSQHKFCVPLVVNSLHIGLEVGAIVLVFPDDQIVRRVQKGFSFSFELSC
ncbi:hypothetical protein FRX31_018996 [Thalictrum thalictroides]|uniref:Uncharacterized protein n=1 Tax=Thalictrum thalictroides TaxID=46969 RepID=A0A7J6W389_THATH|nr:hypothetical protein FRX31_018996 [Thalictrum thalictroides]